MESTLSTSWPRTNESDEGTTVPAIADAQPAISNATIAAIEAAAGAAARLDAIVRPEHRGALALLEAQASSAIEGIYANPLDTLIAIASGVRSGPAGLVASNALMVRAAASTAGSSTAATDLHELLMSETAPGHAGCLRTVGVFIGTPYRIHFVPPRPAALPDALADLTLFNGRHDLPVASAAAIAHAQFETIHPFVDGNGRVGRALLGARLMGGTSGMTFVPLSVGLHVKREAYVAALIAYRDGNVDSIIQVVASAVVFGASRGRTVCRQLDAARSEWTARLGSSRADSGARKLAASLIEHPVISAAQAQIVLQASNVHRHITTLVDAGILAPHTPDLERNQRWFAPDVIAVLG